MTFERTISDLYVRVPPEIARTSDHAGDLLVAPSFEGKGTPVEPTCRVGLNPNSLSKPAPYSLSAPQVRLGRGQYNGLKHIYAQGQRRHSHHRFHKIIHKHHRLGGLAGWNLSGGHIAGMNATGYNAKGSAFQGCGFRQRDKAQLRTIVCSWEAHHCLFNQSSCK